MLETFADGLFIADGEIVDFHGFPYPTRMAVADLGSGRLWVWSPVRLTPALRDDIEEIGSPHYLVSPNRLHHLYLGEWADAFPEAKLYGPASTIRKRTDLAFEAPLTDAPPAAWADSFDHAVFSGSPLFDEVIFFHRASRTVIIGDMSEHFSDAFLEAHWPGWKRGLARLWGITEGRGLAPLEIRATTVRRAPARRMRATMLGWPADNVLMAHGVPVKGEGRAYLARAFAWI